MEIGRETGMSPYRIVLSGSTFVDVLSFVHSREASNCSAILEKRRKV